MSPYSFCHYRSNRLSLFAGCPLSRFTALHRFDVITAVDDVASHRLFCASGVTGAQRLVDDFVLMGGGSKP